jgi:putative heme-binding domain-containing protein
MPRVSSLPVLFALLALPAGMARAADPAPEWLWTTNKPGETETVYLRRTFELTAVPKSATFFGSCDNVMTLFVNGEMVTQHSAWESPVRENITKRLKAGKNVIAVRASNQGSAAGFIAQVSIEQPDGSKLVIVSDAAWKAATDPKPDWRLADFDETGWAKAVSLGKLGVGPWGNVAITAATGGGLEATPVGAIKALPGFQVELLYSVPKDTEGSWVALTPADKGRLIACDQYGGLFRITPGSDAESTKIEALKADIGEAQGLLYTDGALYVVVNGGRAQGSGLYKVRDTNGDDQFDEVKLLKKLDGGGEHGPHAVRKGPDGKLYVIAGNFTKVPEGYDPSSPHRNWAEDQLLPRNPDGGGHDPHIMAPAGWIARTDSDGKHWELLAAGMRNAYDFAFNTDGEIFTYDSDMEWDTGTPWYRPTRVNHLVPGGEYGWRNGTGKWPEYSPDSLGAVVNIGLGSPTGVEMGTGAKFPAKYQRALFINDWTYGKIYAVHLTPSGATYSGNFEVFLEGRPLPVTDLCVHTDGQLYFAIGGRKTQSGLYRVTFAGSESTAPAPTIDEDFEASANARNLRRQLEAWMTRQDPVAVEFCWPHLNSSDRAIRYAARIAIERQDLKLWTERALAETHMTAAIQAMIALARTGERSLQPRVIARLNSLPLERATEEQLVAAARAYALTFIRLGAPDQATAEAASHRLIQLFPNQSELVNRELAAVLVYLKSPAVARPAMQLLASGQSQEDQLYYVLVLRNIANLLSDDDRRAYFSWISLAESSYRGGHSFKKFLQKIREDAAATLTDADRTALKEVIEGKQQVEVVKLETTRQFVHNWQMEDLLPLTADVETGRSFERGRAAYEAAQCAKCHRFAGQGGDTGPDITGVGSRFNTVYLFESLIVPSKAVSDQYLGSVIRTLDGEVITGRVVEETDKEIKVRTDPFARELVTIAKSNIEARQQSRTSEMPQGLINTLSKEEILDLIAYMRSAGNAQDKAFLPAGK